MGETHPSIPAGLRAFIESQPVFFVATAPLAASGHVNLSPKGLDTLRVLEPDRLAYLDLTGSGNETASHLAENGRIVLMWCAFTGAPRIVRVHGRGRVVLPTDAEWSEMRPLFPPWPGDRQILVVEVDRVATSCGTGVPTAAGFEARPQLPAWAERQGEDGLREYRARKNVRSLDGMPAPRAADTSGGSAPADRGGNGRRPA